MVNEGEIFCVLFTWVLVRLHVLLIANVSNSNYRSIKLLEIGIGTLPMPIFWVRQV